MSLSIAILAHGKALKTFERHLPFWQSHEAIDGFVICPEGDAIPQSCSPWKVFSTYKSEHNGRSTIFRHAYLLSLLSDTNTDYHLVFEYDSLAISRQFGLQSGFTGIVKANQDPAEFIAPRYSTPPWLLSHESAVVMSSMAMKWSGVYEHGYNDRWMAAMAHLAGVPILGFDPPGFTANTIGPTHMEDMRSAIQRGATMFHGVKDEWTLNSAIHFLRQRHTA